MHTNTRTTTTCVFKRVYILILRFGCHACITHLTYAKIQGVLYLVSLVIITVIKNASFSFHFISFESSRKPERNKKKERSRQIDCF